MILRHTIRMGVGTPLTINNISELMTAAQWKINGSLPNAAACLLQKDVVFAPLIKVAG